MGNVEAYRMELWRFGNWLENFQIVWTGDKEWREGMDKLEGVWQVPCCFILIIVSIILIYSTFDC